ncbi:hypothetical protein CPB85DRAFT_960419 [Mucidula mucida]|nr:hypothetical protein CPB85DRAFT_960419 [Mucidula mucida]
MTYQPLLFPLLPLALPHINQDLLSPYQHSLFLYNLPLLPTSRNRLTLFYSHCFVWRFGSGWFKYTLSECCVLRVVCLGLLSPSLKPILLVYWARHRPLPLQVGHPPPHFDSRLAALLCPPTTPIPTFCSLSKHLLCARQSLCDLPYTYTRTWQESTQPDLDQSLD